MVFPPMSGWMILAFMQADGRNFGKAKLSGFSLLVKEAELRTGG
ncbi:hypothetical protein BN871_BF_00130 [Paenibacillus sp. P22]|nr:hypothetical protein BN871_BF_00130 [Paenibacillus sp. P22]